MITVCEDWKVLVIFDRIRSENNITSVVSHNMNMMQPAVLVVTANLRETYDHVFLLLVFIILSLYDRFFLILFLLFQIL